MEIRSKSIEAIIKLLRHGMNGALSTASVTRHGWPYASMITYATDIGGSPIFLLSDLSDHTRNLEHDHRVGFLIESCSVLKRPQSGKRITLLGKIKKTQQHVDEQRFLARHPSAKQYACFSDFNFYKMVVSEAHFIGGFAVSEWHKGSNFIVPRKDFSSLVENVESILDHMNSDHYETINHYANQLCRRKGSNWRMIGVDCDGIDVGECCFTCMVTCSCSCGVR